MRWLLAVLAAASLLAIWGSSAGAAPEPALALVPTHYVGHPVTVNCDPEAEMGGAWGYTMPLWDTGELWLEDDLCAALLTGQGDDWRYAMAILVITHESWHLRPWLHALDEARVECAAIRRWHETADLLRVPLEVQARLWPWALVAHFDIGYRYHQYRKQNCRVPGWPPWQQ